MQNLAITYTGDVALLTMQNGENRHRYRLVDAGNENRPY